MSGQYYEHLHESYHIIWSDIMEKSRSVLLETQVKVAEPLQRNNGNNNINDMVNELVPAKDQTHYIITLFHIMSSLLVQGNQRTVWVVKEFPLLKTILNHRKNCPNSINEDYSQVLELLKEHQPERQPTKEYKTLLKSIGTSIISEN